MPQHERNILITRSLSEKQREYARSLGLNPIERPALEFEFPDKWDGVHKTINGHPQSDWVFTSQNGVKALEKLMAEGLQVNLPKTIFAVGSKTRQALNNLELDAKVPSQHDGYHLAKFIIEEKNCANSVLHFHGNLSRKEMKNVLVQNGIEDIEMEVYKTLIQPVTLPDEPVDAILFYSPSAVEGFKQGQGFDQPLPPLFAIGSTTAASIEAETKQPVQKAAQPSTKMLLQAVLNRLFQAEKL